MNLKLTIDELKVLLRALNTLDKVGFNTKLESKLSNQILVEFVMQNLRRTLQLKEKYTIKLDGKTLLVLNHVLPQIYPTNDYDLSVMTRIIKDVNQACLSI